MIDAATSTNACYQSFGAKRGSHVESKINRIPLSDYISERTGALSERQIADYIVVMSLDEAVIGSLILLEDRTASKLLTIQERIGHAHIVSGHALNFLRRNKLPDKGLQDLQQAQGKFARAKLNARS
ncbi:hypothetical protein PVW46_03065 [Mameliella sp. AT18]|uniref:hypothetical protein n=1 Tax=Mameliella TaxID=1434019 RepID=UPI0010568E78|nr:MULTISPECIES: hypothetical protein [Mameliella]MCR9275034.1 hypothetical protein [Paracoccaceae bacterium]MDD9728881.1 hypothetical protein [Mameliella sp. AT18]